MRSDALARRERIITAACELFSTHANNVSLDTVAEKAGVGIATLYRNFPDRTSLLVACGGRFFAEAQQLQEDVMKYFHTNPEHWWYTYVDGLVNMGVSILVSSFAPDDLSTLPEEVASLRADTEKRGEQIIDLAKQAGLVHPDVHHNTFIVGLITVTRPPVPGIVALEPNITHNLVDVFLSGLKHGSMRGLRYPD
ncbi:TetR/AcrR family transcriptional regulator [Corynebacterium aquilae]|uniref:HTH tetR-type domain-containing protein n=1 Tax=Corynebacterium aquilae DSM 44791 TaxID=1431546 RepID=A0A1L7CG80_9CORY|nr:TetR/AcrR family transcriptional regulator [Corynebacterium aquilae]APT84862.1 hypothetical protein CAQU_07015 [Corynebacterium aquilae DSM 44791]